MKWEIQKISRCLLLTMSRKNLPYIPTIVTHMQRKQTKFELKKMLEQFTLQERKKGGGVQETKQGNSFV